MSETITNTGMTYSRPVTLSVAPSRKSVKWIQRTLTLDEFYERLQNPTVGIETLEEYMRLPKSERDDLKDVGGFVAGTLAGGRRKAGAVTGRDLVTLDFDHIPANGAEDLIRTVDKMGCGYAVYSTRKHSPEAPRLRVIFPLDRTVTADEYEPVARYLADQIGIGMADVTTFEPERLMYWPSCCRGAEYICRHADRPLVDAGAVLATYDDWRDYGSWPKVPGEEQKRRTGARQEDPDSKSGIVGAFNRSCGGVIGAMEKYLPGVYEPCDTDPNRYTYTGGSTTGGVLIYDDGKFLYSHHGTDPCSGRLVNAFDLVRLHKFGHLDADAKPGTPVNRLPSFGAMCELAGEDPETAAQIIRERQDSTLQDWEGLAGPEEDSDWIVQAGLKINPKTGLPIGTKENVYRLLKYDPALKDRVAINSFAHRVAVTEALPWGDGPYPRWWTDTDVSNLYLYMERMYGIDKQGNIDHALVVRANELAFNPLQDYLNGLEWDGIQRLDTLFIDYLGAEDSKYTRTITRRIMVAAIARAMNPGCKFDNMLVLCGTQGKGKSTILDKLSKGWFNDTILTFEGKEAAELIQGVWIVEIAELNAMKKADVSRVKQFLSQRVDRYRAPYGINPGDKPRSCVFFGTVNDMEFLSDLTGNRRFWPLDIDVIPTTKDIWRDLTQEEVDQIWAEALMRWRVGERIYLNAEEEAMAAEAQEAHRNASPMEGLIMEFLDRKVPADWQNWTLDRRRDFWNGLITMDGIELVERTRICALEVQTELYNIDRRMTTAQIKAVLRKILKDRGGWVEDRMRFGPSYGIQRGFCRGEQEV